MQWLFLLVCVLAFSPDLPEGIISDPWLSAVGTGSLVAITSLAATLLGRMFGQDNAHGLSPSRFRCYRALRSTLGTVIILNQVLALIVFDWGNVVRRHYALGDWWLLDELCLISPLVIGLASFWWGLYPAEKAWRQSPGLTDLESFWSRPGYVLFQMRVQLGLLLLPLLLYVGLQELGARMSATPLTPESGPGQWLLLTISVVSALGTLGAMPWVLVRVWGTRSLPAGPVRQLLETTARRLGFRYTDFRVWHTRHNLANAMVTGILPWPRYIIFSDALLAELSPDELVAVLGHEIGHIRRCHMPLYLLILLLASLSGGLLVRRFFPDWEVDLLWLTFRRPETGAGWWHWLQLLGLFAAVGGYVWLIFGFVSRRCECEADLYGCFAASCQDPNCSGEHSSTTFPADKPNRLCWGGIGAFIRALKKIAQLNGIPNRQWSWRHGSIAQRIAYLESLTQSAGKPLTLPRHTWIPQWGVLGFLAAISLILSL